MHKKPSRPDAAERPPYAMPCPQCRKLIDARVRLCPYCGVDTNKKLAGARLVFMFVSIALVLGLIALARRCLGS